MTRPGLESVLSGLRGTRVVVVGDLMLDEYAWGDASRISPDAPVPVVSVRRRTRALGGAGNVAHNVVVAGGAVALVAAVGEDAPGAALRALLAEATIDGSGVVTDTTRRTTVKTRVVARGQQMLRLDEEDQVALGPAAREALLARAGREMAGARALVVSDYAKGVITPDIFAALRDTAAGAGCLVVIDPKNRDFRAYAGCTAITPNLKETEAAAGLSIVNDADLREAARRLHEACGAVWVLITRGERGMALWGAEGTFHTVPARAREVYDVTGAGDTVLAYFALALAAGVAACDAAELANAAAGLAVGRVGASAVAPYEILAADSAPGEGAAKRVDLRQAVTRVEHLRSLGRRIVFTNGCFDLLHAGHVQLLESARALGDVLVVAVNSDAGVRRLKGEGRPVVREEDRLRVLAALDAVSLVLVFDDDTPLAAIQQLRPDVLVKGGDYTVETIVGAELVLGWGGEVGTIPLVEGRSTTGLLAGLRRERR